MIHKNILQIHTKHLFKILFLLALVTGVAAQDSVYITISTVGNANQPLSPIYIDDNQVALNYKGQIAIPFRKNKPIKIFSPGYIENSFNFRKKGAHRLILRKDPLSIEQTTDGIIWQDIGQSTNTNFFNTFKILQHNFYSTLDDGQKGAAWNSISRGINTIHKSSDPLVILDGAPILKTHLPSNLESFDFFQFIDLSNIQSIGWENKTGAISRYGSLGGNGIIHLVSKIRKSERINISYNVHFGIDGIALPNKQRLVGLDANQYTRLFIDGYTNKNEALIRIQSQLQTFFPNMVNLNSDGTYQLNGTDTDWIKEIRQNGFSQKHQINISGKAAEVHYNLYGGFRKAHGPILNNSIRNINAGGYFIYDKLKNLTIRNNLSFSTNAQDGIKTGDRWDNPIYVGLQLPPLIPVYDSNGAYNSDFATHFFSGANPVGLLLGEDISNGKFKTVHNTTSLEYKFNNRFVLSGTGSILLAKYNEVYFRNKIFGIGNALGGIAELYAKNIQQYFGEISLSYHTLPNGKIRFRTKIGSDFLQRRINDQLERGEGFLENNFTNIDLANEVILGSASRSNELFVGQFVTTDLTFDSGLFARLNLRLDGSNLFGEDNPQNVYYGLNLGWNLDRLKLIKSNQWISSLMVSASYGKTGNVPLALSSNISTLRTDTYNNQGGLVINHLSNRTIGPEKIKGVDIGFDLGLFKDRLKIHLNWFDQKAQDLIYNKEISQTSGIIRRLENEAAIATSGLEMRMGFVPVKTSKFYWSIYANLTFLRKNNINQLETLFIEKDKIWVQDGFASSYLLYPWSGIDHSTGEPLWASRNDPTTNTNDLNLSGRTFLEKSSNPFKYGKISNFINIGNFSFTSWISFAFDHHIFDESGWVLFSDGQFPVRNQNNLSNDRWSADNINAQNPIFIWANELAGNTKFSSRYLYDGSYIRVSRMEITYNFPPNAISKYRLNQLNIFIGSQNPFTWTRNNQLYLDPESPINGVVSAPIPIAKTWYLGLNTSL